MFSIFPNFFTHSN